MCVSQPAVIAKASIKEYVMKIKKIEEDKLKEAEKKLALGLFWNSNSDIPLKVMLSKIDWEPPTEEELKNANEIKMNCLRTLRDIEEFFPKEEK